MAGGLAVGSGWAGGRWWVGEWVGLLCITWSDFVDWVGLD